LEAAAPKTYSVPDAAALTEWSRFSLYRALKRKQLKWVKGPPGQNGKPTMHLSAAELRRLVAMQEGRGRRKRTTPLIPEGPP
jgi:hypothetical protein